MLRPTAMTKLTIYRDEEGIWQLYGEADAGVEAELADGYRVGEGLGGRLSIFGKPGELGISADAAVLAGILEVPVVSSRRQ